MSETESPTPKPAPPSETDHKPWPMKWIFFAVLIYALFQSVYLFVSTR